MSIFFSVRHPVYTLCMWYRKIHACGANIQSTHCMYMENSCTCVLSIIESESTNQSMLSQIMVTNKERQAKRRAKLRNDSEAYKAYLEKDRQIKATQLSAAREMPKLKNTIKKRRLDSKKREKKSY